MDVSEDEGDSVILAGRYRLGEPIGSGGMGKVWRAHDEVLNRTVAVKELTAAKFVVEAEREVLYLRTKTEARAAARISHPGVVTVHDVLEYDGRPWIVMQYVDGASLGDTIKRSGPVGVAEATRIGLRVLAALRAAHAAGVLHRDVKPANVLLSKDGQVLLTDFGIAAIEGDTSITRTGELIGSVDYLAPERAQGGEPGRSSDLWALGATLFTAVQGVSPYYRNSPLATLQAVVLEDPPYPERAGALAPVILALLGKDPEARPDADETERLLHEAEQGGAPVAEYDAPSPTATRAFTGPLPARSFPSESLTSAAGAPTHVRAGAPVETSAGAPTSRVFRAAAAPGAQDAVHAGPTHGGGSARDTVAPGPARYRPADGTGPMDGAANGSGGSGSPRPRRRKGRVVAAVVVALLVVGGGAAYAVSHFGALGTGADGGRGTVKITDDGSARASASRKTPAPAAGDTGKEPTSLPTEQSTPPPGWRKVAAPEGFTVWLPSDYTRDTSSQSIDYTPDADGHIVRISIDPQPDFPSPLDHMESLEAQIDGLPDYRRIEMQPDTFRDEPQSARWEFSWTQDASQGPPGPRRGVDEIYYGRDGTEYAIYMTGPAADWPTMQKQFATILQSFQPADGTN